MWCGDMFGDRTFSIDAEDIDVLYDTIKQYPKNAEEKINKYLHGKGYERMEKSIHNAIPVSDRRKSHARNASPLRDKEVSSNLSVTISTKTKYHYLYFPDDGTNTIHHAGEKYFFYGGVERETENVMNEMLEAIRFEKE